MKLVLILLLALVIVSCSPAVKKNDATVMFKNTEHLFGKLVYKKETEYIFQFSNPGETPLLIFDVKTSCGCTVPEWPKKPIIQDGNGEIKIKYDAAHPGVFHKTITVYYNGKDSPVTLTIKGQVEYPDDEQAAKL